MKTLQSPSYVAPSQEAAGRRMALPSVPGKTAVVFALACICLSSAPSFAQKTNNDYFKGAGTELLRNVEKYHLARPQTSCAPVNSSRPPETSSLSCGSSPIIRKV